MLYSYLFAFWSYHLRATVVKVVTDLNSIPWTPTGDCIYFSVCYVFFWV